MEPMDAQKLVEQLKNEAKAHPAKASLLVLMCVVLIYVLAPLFTGSTSAASETKEADAKTKQDTVATKAPLETKTSGSAESATNPGEEKDWREIADAIEADENMKPAEALRIDRDPFAPPPEPKVAETETEEPTKIEKPKPKKLHFTPAEAGLVLNSTLLGKRSKLAVLNGKSYHVYDANKKDNRRSVIPFAANQGEYHIETASDTSKQTAYFVLIDVRPRSVELWRFGRRYELKLPGAELANRSKSSERRALPNPVITELAP